MTRRTDVLVIGAGVFGLWTALECARAGLRVICVDRDLACKDGGVGASWGILGALTPFGPSPWRALKQFQFDALTSLEEAAAGLTEATGLPTGYRRSGRLSPLATRGERDRAVAQMEAASVHWQGDGIVSGAGLAEEARFEVLDALSPELAPDLTRFLPEENRPYGLIRDTLSARIVPRLYMQALARAVAQVADLRPGWEAQTVDGTTGRVVFSVASSEANSGPNAACTETLSEEIVSAGAIVVAAGWQSPMLAKTRTGTPVRGQAALLRAETPENMPVIRLPGLHIVAQPDGLVAVGSTKEPGNEPGNLSSHSSSGRDGNGDTGLEALIARARRLCPPLAEAPVVERWAGIRPKPHGRDPTVGPVPGHPHLYLASGGYGIGLGIGHLVGKALAGLIAKRDDAILIPEEFAPMVTDS